MKIATFCLALFGCLAAFAHDRSALIEAEFQKAYKLLHSDYDSAYDIGVKTQAMAHEAGLAYEEANALYIQAWVLYEKRHKAEEALLRYLSACATLRHNYLDSKKSCKLYVELLIHVGSIYMNQFSPEEAMRFFDHAIEITKTNDLPVCYSRALWNKSMAYEKSNQLERSLQEVDRAIEQAEISGEERMILNALNAKGVFLVKMDKTVEAREIFNRIVEHSYEVTDSSYFRGMAWHNIGYSYSKEGRFDECIYALGIAEEHKSCKTEKFYKYITLQDMCETYMLMGDFAKAKMYGDMALELYGEVQFDPYNYNLFDYLSKVYHSLGYCEQGNNFSQRYFDENDRFVAAMMKQPQLRELAASFFDTDEAVPSPMYADLGVAVVIGLLVLIILFVLIHQAQLRQDVQKALREIEL